MLFGVVTSMAAKPATPLGTEIVSARPSLATFVTTAGAPPTRTVVPITRSSPWSTTASPPAVSPAVGVAPRTRGRYVWPLLAVSKLLDHVIPSLAPDNPASSVPAVTT